ncbi:MULTISPECIES: thiolase family protein [Virgibacillus]|uniref:acetyl-CoA C-acyltransferase n=1 Tax=Virgibacillus dokdonensis TaxID=302167 RepID=A0A2K9IXI8_9BACI|nr:MULTISPECIES: acetyl-CoA C-acyltransferase [Virgibacillus]AUJ23493.1 Beta-ketoadipyl-CoA thiolase [Virgibacillus dokdonensis]NWO12596.1 acetyl-CoA C-acyltransferase [Virgibacillus sp.]
MKEVVIVDAVRTPIGRYNGSLKYVRPDDLASVVIQAIIDRQPKLPIDAINEVILGNANGAGEENRNVARMALLLAGLPVRVTGTTVNRLCGSGMDAVHMAARAIMVGDGDIYIAGGTESMTRAPYVLPKSEFAFQRGNKILLDTTIGWRFTNPRLEAMYGADSMPQTAENVAKQFQITREEQDDFAYASQMKAKAAIEANKFYDELISVKYMFKGEEKVVDKDEHPRPATTREKLASLQPLFGGGTVTAGNASGINDGASALLLMSKEKAEQLGVKPMARYIASGTSGVEPSIMGIGPIEASKKALQRANLQIENVDLVELNEAFASQSIACMKQLELNPEIVNVNGGSIAFGHPLGASGARILTTLLHEMNRRNSKYALATMCIGVGQGIATVIEKW